VTRPSTSDGGTLMAADPLTVTGTAARTGAVGRAGPGRDHHRAQRTSDSRVVRVGTMSARVDGRATSVCTVLLLATFAVFCINISVGDFPIPLRDVVSYLFGHGNASSRFIVGELRLPRSLTGLMVGSALGLSGAIFQSIARNPLASPDVIGVTSGAALFAVAAIVLAGSGDVIVGVGASNVPIAALVGGLTTALLVYLLAYRRGLVGYRLVLVGIGVSAVMMSGVSYLLTRATLYEASKATVWITGSLSGRGWEHVKPVGLALAVLVPITLAQARQLRALQLGDDAARALGSRIELSRLSLIVCGVGLAALATASAGPVSFVAFVAPVLARRLIGRGAAALFTSMCVGGLLLLVSDLIARRALPAELPVGIVTSIIGAPYLLWLLWRTNSIGSGG
jgi:iron complex transport system permease protein